MRRLALLLCALAACGGADELTLIVDAAPPLDLSCLTCNPISHSGCFADERCSFVHDGTGGVIGDCGGAQCLPDGSLGRDAPCTITAGLPDDCMAGTLCTQGTCRELCSSGAVECTSGVCWSGEALLGWAGTCAPACEPLASECPAGQGCYPLHPSGEPGCVIAGDALEGAPCSKAEDCIAGTTCTYLGCRRLCDPTLADCPSPQTCEPWPGDSSFGWCL